MALAFLQEIGEASLQMDTISLNAAISACERPGGAGPIFSGGGAVKSWRYPQVRWMVFMGNPKITWMKIGGVSPWIGNTHVYAIYAVMTYGNPMVHMVTRVIYKLYNQMALE